MEKDPQAHLFEIRETAFQARYEYLSLPPQLPANPDRLKDIFDRMRPEISENNLTICQTAGSVALELASIYAPFRPGEADEWSQQAQSILESVVQNHPSQLKRLETKLLLDTVPLFSPAPTEGTELLQKKAADTGAQILGSYVASPNTEQMKEIRGLINKQLVLLALSGLEEQGIVAYSSFLREKTSRKPIENTRYKWDVSVESNGKLLPFGKYPLRITSNDRNEKLHLHIVPIATNVLANRQGIASSKVLFESALRVATGQFTAVDMRITEKVQTGLVESMAAKGVYRTDTPYLALRAQKNKSAKDQS